MANFVDEHYRKFFDIDPEYYPQVNEAIVIAKPSRPPVDQYFCPPVAQIFVQAKA